MDTTTPIEPSLGDGSAARPVRAVAVAIGLTVLALAGSLLGGVALAVPLFLLEFDVQSVSVLVALTAAGQIGFLAVAYLYARYADIRVRIAMPTRRDLGYAAGGLLAALALAVGLSVVLSLLNLVPGSVIEDAATNDPTLLLGLALLSVLIVAPAEEFLFRGVVQGRLRRAFGPAAAIAGASLLFGSLHLANYTGTIAPIVAASLLIASVGAVFGVVYERTDNLVVPVVAHAVYNVILFSIAFLTI
ncbi:CPBP family intramembrane glutamic endopeptidase [Halorarius litoreus]|uniref:CPBP family intramembrane glutamic endopeptidase n=1 Tax=Halorarius litoreus TaxID=2962676 RepID=UPI0020CBB7CA|nr:CPBP family intramembrane glutamic endopeptidase [Halorarius litoreus]